MNANGDLTVDLRSDIAAESRAKIVYEYLMQFTGDPEVLRTLDFLTTREIAHFQMFTAALETIQPNFPPGVLQGNPRYTHTYFKMSDTKTARGPWNQGQGPWGAGEEWQFIDRPREVVERTKGLTEMPVTGSKQSMDDVRQKNAQLSKQRSQQVKSATPSEKNRWSEYQTSPREKAS